MTNTEIQNASKIFIGITEINKMYIGNTLIYLKLLLQLSSLLPSGYTELEYISSTVTGSQYIDLNIKLYETLNTDYDIAIKFNLKGVGSDNNTLATMFQNQNTTSPWPGVFIRKNKNNVQGRYVGANTKDPTIGDMNLIIELAPKTSPDKNVYSLNNGGSTHNYGTSLFCAFSDSNNTPYRLAEADLYYFKLWVEGTLTRDMVPCINPNNVVGLYDLVNNVFYSSPNGVAFVAGPTV